MLRLLAKFLKVLNSDADPGQISLGFCFAMVAGFTPLLSLHNLLVLLVIMLIRVNLSAFILGLAFFSGVAYALDPMFHSVGLALLTSPRLEGLWTSMYNTTFWRLERFNNTIVMGSIAVSAAAFVPMLLILNLAVRRYREHVLEYVRRTRVAQALKASKFYNLYKSARGWGEVL